MIDDCSLQAAIGGDLPAMSRLLREHVPAPRAQLVIDPQWRGILDADDVFQVTFLEAFLQHASAVDIFNERTAVAADGRGRAG